MAMGRPTFANAVSGKVMFRSRPKLLARFDLLYSEKVSFGHHRSISSNQYR